MNATTDTEKAAINQELKELYNTLDEASKKYLTKSCSSFF